MDVVAPNAGESRLHSLENKFPRRPEINQDGFPCRVRDHFLRQEKVPHIAFVGS